MVVEVGLRVVVGSEESVVILDEDSKSIGNVGATIGLESDCFFLSGEEVTGDLPDRRRENFSLRFSIRFVNMVACCWREVARMCSNMEVWATIAV